MTKNRKSHKSLSQYIQGASILTIIYLSLKLFISPIIVSIQTGKLVEIPDITPSNVCLILFILLFQTDLLYLIKTFKIGSQGFEAEFR